jgi:tetratricopeptide (TPR) repeat protein
MVLFLYLLLLIGCNRSTGQGSNAPSTGDTDAQVGANLIVQRQFAEAIPHLNRALEKTLQIYSKSDVLTMIGNCYSELDQLEKALEFHNKALNENPKNYKALANIGIVYRMMGKYEKASHYYSLALELAPDYAEAHDSFGALYLFQEKYAKAIEHLERAVSLDDSLAVSHSNLALAYASVGRFDDADSELKKAVIRGYHQPDVIKNRIDQLRRLSDSRE